MTDEPALNRVAASHAAAKCRGAPCAGLGIAIEVARSIHTCVPSEPPKTLLRLSSA
jgi:hypothetical protein